MALSKQPYKGTRDFFPADMRLRNFMFHIMTVVSEKFAYEPYDGPILEEVELYKAKSGEELINDQIYSFTDRGDRFVAIRPEMTPTVARMVAQIHREVAKPLRWFSIPNLMRYEKPQKGRLREFYQYNADIFGAGAFGDLEIIQLSVEIMRAFGATKEQFEIHVNDRRIVDFVFNHLIKLSPEANKKLYKLVDRKNKMPAEKFEQEVNSITQNELASQIFNDYVNSTDIKRLETFIKKHLNLAEKVDFLLDEPASAHHEVVSASIKPLFDLFKKIDNAGISEFVTFDPSIVRGLDYYTGMVFEIFDKHPENNRAIAGGGSYANLLQIFNEPSLEGVGIGLGEVPLMEFLKSHKLMPDFTKPDFDVIVGYFTTAGEKMAFDVSRNLRAEGLKVETFFGEVKPKKLFSQTERKNFSAVIVISDSEVASSEVQVKHLKSQKQENIKISDTQKIVSFVKGI
jgi:histidyl-tRNA synthetase